MVRYPAASRRSLGDVEDMRIRTPDGSAVPFSAVAEADLGEDREVGGIGTAYTGTGPRARIWIAAAATGLRCRSFASLRHTARVRASNRARD
jgi:hypothetical protein